MNRAIQQACELAHRSSHEFLMPEHVLLALCQIAPSFVNVLKQSLDCQPGELAEDVEKWLASQEKAPKPVDLELSSSMRRIFTICKGENADRVLCVTFFIEAMMRDAECMGAYLLTKHLKVTEVFLLLSLHEYCDAKDSYVAEEELDDDLDDLEDDDLDDDDLEDDDEMMMGGPSDFALSSDWKQWTTDITAEATAHLPIIGREAELDRTIEVLCRMEKNNPLHIGEPGVGKTALIYGLAQRIVKGDMPYRLQKAHIYSIDMGQLMAGAQFRGEFEKRLKDVLDGATAQGNSIIYLDEIHLMMGGEQTQSDSICAFDVMKPYLDRGKLRFIGSTTYEAFNRTLAKSKAVTRRFQQIDIKEPSVEDTLRIVEALLPTFQNYHDVIYRKDAWTYAVESSARLITNRQLPDKAIDIIDEAGAYLEVHPRNRLHNYVTKSLVDEILNKVCRIDADALKETDNNSLKDLVTQMKSQIYGQDKAIERLTDAVMMAKAGLTDSDKPMASLLFVGPTGVGKTEVARVLARQLGVELVRFDMSEYAEKHTVAKLIGSPAGYVGYDDGGLLTSAIRKTPNCVLLLDEIEKAHSDIYNILLQVMDYARLTDNRGQQADFHHVIIIMTSNAGAQYASQASVGFTGHVSRGEAMRQQVKRVFKPEFINRLTDIVTFRDMDKTMATLILRKKLALLSDKLGQRQVKLTVSQQAFDRLLTLGFTPEYGAREMDRVIGNNIKPLLMRALLFGSLSKGGIATVDCKDGVFVVK